MALDPSAAAQTPVPPAAETVAPAQLASWGVRAAAYAIDWLVTVAIGVAVGIAIGLVAVALLGQDEVQRIREALTYGVGIPLALAYAPLLLRRSGAHNGQTLGKQAMRIRVVRESGEPVTLRIAVLREVVGRQLPIVVTYGIYGLLDYLWPLQDAANQCVHDKLVQTRVVRVDAPPRVGTLAPAPPPPPPADDAAPIRGWLPPAPGG